MKRYGPLVRAGLPFLLYAAASAVFCSPLFRQPAGLGFNDWDQHLFYYASVFKSVVEYAQPPFWNPWYCGGNVLWQNPQVALLSPAYPLTVFMPLSLAMKVNIVLHYWVGFVGMHLLLRRIVGVNSLPVVFYLGALVVFSGALAMHVSVGHSWILSAFYLPLLLFLFCQSLTTEAVRYALLAGAVVALMIYNGGFQILPMAVIGIGLFAAIAAAAQRRFTPVLIAAAIFTAAALYAAPRLLPEILFVTSDRFRDTRFVDEQPDRMSIQMLVHTYLDRSQHRRTRLSGQRFPWHEYGNYIGVPGAVLMFAGVVWLLVHRPRAEGGLGASLALTSLGLFLLSVGEFNSLAPASLLSDLPFFSNFRIHSRYGIVFVTFGAVAIGGALRSLPTRALAKRATSLVWILCLLGVADLVVHNAAQFKGVFSQRPLDARFHPLKKTATLVTDARVNPYAQSSPMLRALMRDRSVYNCYENFQLTRTADATQPLVFSDGNASIVGTRFSPNRVEFAAIGGSQASVVLLNQNYSPGWRSSAGPVVLNPAYKKPSVTLAAGQTGKFAFTFRPPGLAAGTVLFLLALIGSAFTWKRQLAWNPLSDPTGARIELTLIVAGLTLLVFALPHAMSADGRARFDALAALLDEGKLSATPYSLVGPLFATPLYYIGKLALGSEWWCARFNTLLLAAGFAFTALLLARGAERRVIRTFGLLLIAGSMFPGHVRDFFGEVFTAMLVLIGVAALSRERTVLGWTSMTLAVVNTPATIVGMLFVALRHVSRSSRLRHLLAVCAAAALILGEAWIRRGHPLTTGYEASAGVRTVLPYSGLPGFSYPFFFGVLSVLLSFGKGLVFFAPGLLLIGRKDPDAPEHLRECIRYTMWFLAGLILVYSKWWAWYGGFFWGPRFFLIASIPASLAIALTLRQTRSLRVPALVGVIAIVALSGWVAINGGVFNLANLRACNQNNYALEFLCWYVPEFSVLWRPFVVSSPLSAAQQAFVGYCLLVCFWLLLPAFAAGRDRAGELLRQRAADAKKWRF